MKKIFMLFAAMLVAIAMNANVVDTLTAASFGIPSATGSKYTTFQATMRSGAEYIVKSKPGEQYISLKGDTSCAALVVTKSAGYAKKVWMKMNYEKTKSKTSDKYVSKKFYIYGSNVAYASPSDLFDGRDSTGLLTTGQADGRGEFLFLTNNTFVGVRLSNKGPECVDSIFVEWSDQEIPTVDTISVSDVPSLVAAGNDYPHYIKGVVARPPFSWYEGNYSWWMTDIDNPSDSVEAFDMMKDAKTKFKNLDEAKSMIGFGDTILIYATKLSYYTDPHTGENLYETDGGYYFRTCGKASFEDISDTYKYGVAAYALEKVDSLYTYEIVLSKVSADDENSAIHFFIGSRQERGIVGSYTLNANSRMDEGGAISGSLSVEYVSMEGNANKYLLESYFMVANKIYGINSEYTLPGFDSDGEEIILKDDRPFQPAKEGDTLTCSQAASYAKSLGGSTSEGIYYVHGFANSANKKNLSSRFQQSVYMNDLGYGTNNFEAFACYVQGIDSIIKGDEVLVKGKLKYDAGYNITEIVNGQIYRIGGSDTKIYRDIDYVEVPDTAITVAKAVEIGNALSASEGATSYTGKYYTVFGYISYVDYKDDQTKNDTASWTMADNLEEKGTLQAYKCFIPNYISVGDKVMVVGQISKYVKDPTTSYIEISKGTGMFATGSPTGLEDIKAQAAQLGVEKIMIDGRFYILQDNVLYLISGGTVAK